MKDTLPDGVFRRIVENAPEAILLADRAGLIRLWNAGAEAIFGYRSDEALGQSLDLIIPEKQRARHWEGYARVMREGATRYGKQLLSVPALRRDGERISLEFSVLLLRDPDGTVSGIAAIMRDVTARWREEKALREQLRKSLRTE